LKEKGCDIPKPRESETIFDYQIVKEESGKFKWSRIDPPTWKVPEEINFSHILMPTIDSYRAEMLAKYIAFQPYSTVSRRSTLIIGGPGTAKTSSVLMYAAALNDPNKNKDLATKDMLLHRINFSSATQPIHFQTSIESVCEQKIQKGFGPKEFKQMTVFVDDFSMPEKNEW
jgi:ATP-dependent exoDNAse (exonuclease V) alpha subunit